ncbi:MAG: DUF1565 domain-containing protein [Solirubrobacterales bacterium]|nr:DUF1565 domain-containing protein [Solirubrobacterales bacterium]
MGCFMAGTYDSSDRGIKVDTREITLTSAPGERATVVGRWWIARGADDVTISHLNLNGRNDAGQVGGPVVNAADTHFDDVDVSNDHTTICFILGSVDYGAAIRTVIENSRIHDCGILPPANHDHGIYVEESRDAVIRNNWIYDNADRGIQFYPHAVGTHVYGNVIDGNGQGVIFSGTNSEASSENVVENNIISNSEVRWNAESYWGALVGSGNVLRGNCVWGSNSNSYYNQNGGVQPPDSGAKGFSASDNTIAEPVFADPASGDFTLQPGSPCAEGQQEDAGEEKVKLKKHRRVVRGKSPLLLSGYADTSEQPRRVTVQRWTRAGWRPFARRKLRRNGRFVIRKRPRRRRGLERLRAVVPGVGASRVVKVRIRSGGPRIGLAAARRAGGAS